MSTEFLNDCCGTTCDKSEAEESMRQLVITAFKAGYNAGHSAPTNKLANNLHLQTELAAVIQQLNLCRRTSER